MGERCLGQADGADIDLETEFLVPHPEDAAILGERALLGGVDVVGGTGGGVQGIETEAGQERRHHLRALDGVWKHLVGAVQNKGDIASLGRGDGEDTECELVACQQAEVCIRERVESLGRAISLVGETGTAAARIVGEQFDHMVARAQIEGFLEIARIILLSVGVGLLDTIDPKLATIAATHPECVIRGDIDAEAGAHGPAVVGPAARRRRRERKSVLHALGRHGESRRVKGIGHGGGCLASLAAFDVNTRHLRNGRRVEGHLQTEICLPSAHHDGGAGGADPVDAKGGFPDANVVDPPGEEALHGGAIGARADGNGLRAAGKSERLGARGDDLAVPVEGDGVGGHVIDGRPMVPTAIGPPSGCLNAHPVVAEEKRVAGREAGAQLPA